MKKWEILNNKFRVQGSGFKVDDLIKVLLENRGIKTKKEIDDFLNPRLENVTVQSVGINKNELRKALNRIKKAIKEGEQIVIFGDYDVDGITGSAILWETLNGLGAKVLPYIPHRIDEGYGLSETGIKNLELRIKNVKLIITVDNGIVANKAVDFANEQGIDVIITDHHVPSKKLPRAFAIVHTTKLCGAAVAYMLAQELARGPVASFPPASARSRFTDMRAVGNPSSRTTPRSEHLSLAAIATVADLVPLTGASRTIVKFGLEALGNTERLGLLELFKEAGIEKTLIGTYEIGHIIAPRINAMGRMESAMDSLRLLCTTNKERARALAHTLSSTNVERQKTTEDTVLHAKALIGTQFKNKLIFIGHETYQQGVIGLVASKLVEEYYLPSIVISKGKIYSKASARSIFGFNIIEFIRSASEFLVDAGGHPMAAGFTVETAKLEGLQQKLFELAHNQITKNLLERTLRIDCELPLDFISFELYDALQKLSPFGMTNPVPTFVSKDVMIENMRVVGNGGKHLKLEVRSEKLEVRIEGIVFNMGERAGEFHAGDKVDLVYTIDADLWNGNRKLQLKIRDIRGLTS